MTHDKRLSAFFYKLSKRGDSFDAYLSKNENMCQKFMILLIFLWFSLGEMHDDTFWHATCL